MLKLIDGVLSLSFAIWATLLIWCRTISSSLNLSLERRN